MRWLMLRIGIRKFSIRHEGCEVKSGRDNGSLNGRREALKDPFAFSTTSLGFVEWYSYMDGSEAVR